MNKVIATIQLAQGRVGFYDELSRIHLSIGNPTARVYSGTNCARLRRAVKDGVIRLVDGTLGGDVPQFKVVNVNGQLKLASNLAEEMKPVIAEAAAEVKGVEVAEGGDVKDAQPEEIKAEEPAAEVETEDAEETAKVEETTEEVAEEKPKKKATRKKAAKKAE